MTDELIQKIRETIEALTTYVDESPYKDTEGEQVVAQGREVLELLGSSLNDS